MRSPSSARGRPLPAGRHGASGGREGLRTLIPAYRTGRPSGPALLVVLSGPSGVGKDTILSILKRWGLPLYFASTATTRPRRRGDPTRGGFLRFLTPAEYDRLLAEGGLLEHAEVYGYRYGVPKAPIREALARGQDVILRVDVQGVSTIKRLLPGAVTIFLEPPSLQALETRLRRRGADDEATVRRRLAVARREMEEAHRFDYRLVNEEGSPRKTAARIVAIIAAEKSRAGRKPIVVP